MRLNLKTNQRTFVFLLIAIAVTLPFQNCIEQGSFSSDTSSGSSGGSYSSTSTPSGTGTGGTTTPPPSGTVLTAEQKQALCQGLVGKPTLQSVAMTEATVKVGMGADISGDVSSGQINAVANSGISNKAQFDANTCVSLFTLALRCEVVEGDAARPIALNQALDVNGANAVAGADSRSLVSIAKGLIKMDKCAMGFNYNNMQASGVNSTNSQIVSNADDGGGFRCASGSFYVRYTVRNSVGNVQQNSSEAYLKVNVQNGCWDEVKLTSSNITQNSQFGSAVAVDGNMAAVVAQTDQSGSATKVGSVSLFEKSGSTWQFRQKIVLPGAVANDTIQSVALKGSVLFIGSPYRGTTGAVFQYEKNGQDFVYVSEVARPSTGNATLDAQEQYFGFALAFNGSQLAVGAPHYSDMTQQRMGQVYIYNVAGGRANYAQTLSHPDSVKTYKGFGMSLAMSGNYLAVGAPQAVTKEQLGKGDVIVLSQSGSGYNVVKKLTAGSINNGAKFGYAVAMNGARLLVGAPGYDKGKPTESPNSGGVYYFADFNTVTPGTPNYSGNKEEWMGVSVALNDAGLFFSNPYGKSRSGYVDFYKYGNLSGIAFRLFGLDTVNNDAFGWGLAANSTNVVVGARVKNNPEANAGAGYMFTAK